MHFVIYDRFVRCTTVEFVCFWLLMSFEDSHKILEATTTSHILYALCISVLFSKYTSQILSLFRPHLFRNYLIVSNIRCALLFLISFNCSPLVFYHLFFFIIFFIACYSIISFSNGYLREIFYHTNIYITLSQNHSVWCLCVIHVSNMFCRFAPISTIARPACDNSKNRQIITKRFFAFLLFAHSVKCNNSVEADRLYELQNLF